MATNQMKKKRNKMKYIYIKKSANYTLKGKKIQTNP